MTSADRASHFLIRHRWLYLGLCCAISLLMVMGVMRATVASSFADLMPLGNPIVEVFKRYPNFGAPLTVQLLVEVKQGTIYNPKTLAKIFYLTRDVDLLPGVDHDTVISIATTKAQVVRAVPGGITAVTVM